MTERLEQKTIDSKVIRGCKIVGAFLAGATLASYLGVNILAGSGVMSHLDDGKNKNQVEKLLLETWYEKGAYYLGPITKPGREIAYYSHERDIPFTEIAFGFMFLSAFAAPRLCYELTSRTRKNVSLEKEVK